MRKVSKSPTPSMSHTYWKQNRDVPGSPVVKTSPSNAGDVSSIPGWGAKIPHTSQPKNQNIKQKQYCNKFNEDFKNGPHQKKKILKKNKNKSNKWNSAISHNASLSSIWCIPLSCFFSYKFLEINIPLSSISHSQTHFEFLYLNSA